MLVGMRITKKLRNLLAWANENNISDKESISSLTVGDLREASIEVESPAPTVECEEFVGHRVQIEVAVLEFDVAGKTIWVQSPDGATVLRIKCEGAISFERCETSPVSHLDIIVGGGLHFCLAEKDCPE